MTQPAYDFSDVLAPRPAPDQAPPAGAPLPILGPGAGAPSYDFSDVLGAGPAAPAPPEKTGQEKAQDIARAAGVSVSPEFGATMPQRLAADFGKGLATSLPGRLVDRFAGSGGAATKELAGLPASQPIPFFPDADTIGMMAGDAAMFSLVGNPLTALGDRVGVALAERAPILTNVLMKGSLEHVRLAQQMAGELTQANAEMFAAVGRTISVGMGFGGLEKAAGSDNVSAAAAGFLAGTATALRPAFAALKTVAHFEKLDSAAYRQAEGSLASMLDTTIPKWIALAQNADTLPPQASAEFVGHTAAELLDPGFGDEVKNFLALARSSLDPKPFASAVENGDIRSLIPAWEEVVTKTSRGGLAGVFERQGWRGARNAWTGLTTSIDSSLRKMGPEGTALANGIRNGQVLSDRYSAELRTPVMAALNEASDEDLYSWIAKRESGAFLPNAAGEAALPSSQLEATLNALFDEHALDRLKSSGVDLPSYLEKKANVGGLAVAGAGGPETEATLLHRYFPIMLDQGKTEEMLLQDPKLRAAWKTALGIPQDSVLDVNRIKDLFEAAHRAPQLNVLRSSLDMRRALNLTYTQVKDLGLPVADARVTISRYIRQVADRAAFAENLGVNGERVSSLLDSIIQSRNLHSQIGDFLKDSVRKSLGMDSEVGDVAQVFNFFNSNFIVPTHLPLATISNAGQSVNTMAQVGMGPYFKGLGEWRRELKLAKSAGIEVPEFLAKAKSLIGELSDDMGDFLTGQAGSNAALLPAASGRTGLGRLNLGRWTLSKLGFNATEDFNRTTAMYAGRAFVRDSVADAVAGNLSPNRMAKLGVELGKLGLNLGEMVARGGPTDAELFDGAVGVMNATQFRIRPSDLPLYWSSPNAAVFRMLKTFAFNQARFIAKSVVQPASDFIASGGKRGTLRPAAFMLAGFPATGYAIGAIRSTLKGQTPFEGNTPMGTYLSAMSWVGGFGILTDFAQSLESGELGVVRFAAGPSISELLDASDALIRSGKQTSLKPFGRFLIQRTIPGVSQNLFGSRDGLLKALDMEQ